MKVFIAASNSDIVACFAVSVGAHPFALRSAAIVRLILTLLSCIARGVSPLQILRIRLLSLSSCFFVFDLASCLVVSGHCSTQTCAQRSTGLHVWWSLRALFRLAPVPRVLLTAVHRESSHCGLGLLRYTGCLGSFCSCSNFCTVTGTFCIVAYQSLRTDRDMFHPCCSSTFSARLECANLDLHRT